MAKEKIIGDLKDIISDYIELDDNFDAHMSLGGDMGLDSFGLISMVSNIEDHFNIRIPDYELANFVTVEDLVGYIQTNQF
ncbi:MAG: acyl carrier protein [Clostridiales bacterium]|nr:acyl carrier protein [Clostridiales bacterium]